MHHNNPNLITPKNTFTLPPPQVTILFYHLRPDTYSGFRFYVQICYNFPNMTITQTHNITYCVEAILNGCLRLSCECSFNSFSNSFNNIHISSINLSKFPLKLFTNMNFSLYLYIIISNDYSIQLFIVSIMCSFVTDRPVSLNR